MARTLTQEQAEAKVIAYNKDYQLTSPYKGTTGEAYLTHKCGHRYPISRFKSFFEGKNKCPICFPSTNRRGVSRPNRITEEDLKQKFKDTFPDGEYEYLKGYTKMDKKTTWVKHKCGHEFPVAPKMMFGVKQSRCPVCANKKRGRHFIKENYLEEVLASQPHGHEYEWKEPYNDDNKEKLLILHKTCNRSYRVRPNDFQQGYKCPHCSAEKKQSYQLTLIKDYLNKNNVKFVTEAVVEGLVYKNKLRFDLLVNKLFIEYDGIQHFKASFSDDNFKKQVIRDRVKNQWIQGQNEYSLLRIPPNLSDSQLEEIMSYIIKGKLPKEIIDKYKLYVYNRKKQILYNSHDYYTSVRKEFFNETADIFDDSVSRH